MARSVIQRLLADETDVSADGLLDGSPEIEAAEAQTRQALAKRAAGEDLEEEVEEEGTPPGAKAEEPEEPKTASEPRISPKFVREVDEAIAECDKLASDYAEAVKTAADGEQAGYQAQGLLFRKVAHYLREQKKVAEGYQKYASAVLQQSAEDRQMHETLKVASALFDDGSMDLPEDKPLIDVIRSLSQKDLAAVKTAHELFAGTRMEELGSAVERTKRASDEPPRADGSMSAWLAHHPSLSSD